MTFAHYKGEPKEETDEYIAALKVELARAKQSGATERAAAIEAELERVCPSKPVEVAETERTKPEADTRLRQKGSVR